jgi:hypothetical protein
MDPLIAAGSRNPSFPVGFWCEMLAIPAVQQGKGSRVPHFRYGLAHPVAVVLCLVAACAATPRLPTMIPVTEDYYPGISHRIGAEGRGLVEFHLDQRRRPSARLLITDPAGRVLLFRFVYQRGALAGQSYWATPGGAVEEGETFAQAAVRELQEVRR